MEITSTVFSTTVLYLYYMFGGRDQTPPSKIFVVLLNETALNFCHEYVS